MNITDMEIGETLTIISLASLEKSFRKRIMDFGIYEGAKVVLLNSLSFKSLYLIEIDDIEICIRANAASKIEVSL